MLSHSFKHHNGPGGQITDFHLHFAEGETKSMMRFSKSSKVKNIGRTLVESKQCRPTHCAPIPYGLLRRLFWNIREDSSYTIEWRRALQGTRNVLWVHLGRKQKGWEIRAHFPEWEALGGLLRTWSDFERLQVKRRTFEMVPSLDSSETLQLSQPLGLQLNMSETLPSKSAWLPLCLWWKPLPLPNLAVSFHSSLSLSHQ